MIFKDKKVAVLGFGVEGKDLVKYLLGEGARVTIHDIKSKKDLQIKGFGKCDFVCGKNYLQGLEQYDMVFRSPGIYRYKKELYEAEKKGVTISSATKLFFDKCKGKIIGITGTKGKGTTATLIYQSFKNDGKDVFLLGNIGEPFLEKLGDINKDTWIVLELSSFQMIDLHKSPHVAVVLNITEDHLDWHKNTKEYVNSKKNIVLHQSKNDKAVISFDYKKSKSFSQLGKGKKYFFSRKNKVEGCYLQGDDIKVSIDGKSQTIASKNDLFLQGEHILENSTAAVCASYLAGVSLRSIKKSITQFKGYEHRMEYVKKYKGVIFINDSAGTTPHSVLAAVGTFKEPITLIIGGFDKGVDYSVFAKKITKRQNVTNIVLIGDIAKSLEKLLTKTKYSGNLINMGKVSMEKIVKKAFEMTRKGGVVLLSPVTSSFDMFNNYKDRGNKFKEAVNSLK